MTTPTEPPRPRDRFGCVHEWFERTAAARGEAVAVTAPGRRLTYGELDRRANRLARHLRTLGVGPEVPVGVCVERSAGLVVALLAVFKAGGAYLPLDPAYPDDRLMYMLADAGAAVLLGDDPKRGLGAEHHLGPGADLTAYPDTPLSPAARPGNLAYVMYTSGSTGAPKGVMIEHRAITRLFTATRDLFGFGPGEVWTLFHTYAFDFSVWEMWGALLHGGRLVVVPHDVARSPEAFHDLLHHERVTVLNQTPAAFRQLIRIDAQAPAQKSLALRWVIFGGEALPTEMLRPWFDRHGDEIPALVNMYGITETTVHVTHRRMSAADLGAPGSLIGRPLPDLSASVLDESGAPAPEGELYVGGAGVARGYLGRPSLTAERFVPDPGAATPGGRRYRTGDRAADHGGDLEYLGRTDFQVKIRGHRIEPAEIERALSTHPAVREAVVVAGPEESGDRRLVAYWAGGGGSRTGPSELRAHLRRTLPEYMLPGVFVPMERLPLTPNGKLDRAALPDPGGTRPELEETYRTPGDPVEEELARIWADVLALDRVGLDDDFFELGGHSLLAAQVLAEARARLGARTSLRTLFDRPTVRGFAAALRSTTDQLTGTAGGDPGGQAS